jgi:pyruvate kinase
MELFCTLGPASFNAEVIRKLDALAVTLFRINLSHTQSDEIADLVSLVRANSGVPICLDTEGAQIRTGRMRDGTIQLTEHHELYITADPVLGDAGHFNLYPRYAFALLKVGDLLAIDFNATLVQIISIQGNDARARVITGGQVGSNKAVSINRQAVLDPLTEKDREAIDIGRSLNILHYALSFANHADDVTQFRRLVGEDAFVISKIESARGLANCEMIAKASDGILIDRGDLSREIPIERLPLTQKHIINLVKQVGRPVYVATNFLETMISSPVPTRAEVNDIYNTLLDGADGLVLAAETAIGQNPVACATMIQRLGRQFQQDTNVPLNASTTQIGLVEPHGGTLVSAIAEPNMAKRAHAGEFPVIHADDLALSDVENICDGTFSPITGFMALDELNGTLFDNRLTDGSIWTLPIVLPIFKDQTTAITPGRFAVIKDATGSVRALIDVSNVYEAKPEDWAQAWFGTTDDKHPGLKSLTSRGDHFVSGKVFLIDEDKSSHSTTRLSPSSIRSIFQQKGWNRVVGFHSRNVPHQVHVHLQLQALRETRSDGLLINPVIGSKKSGDFLSDVIMDGYSAMLKAGIYHPNTTLLTGFETYSRYAGPREAVFTALCRKNMGCSHFIVGRDHTGVANFYREDAVGVLFDALPDLGISPVFFETHVYDADNGNYVPEAKASAPKNVSGTAARTLLLAGENLPDWYIHPLVQEVLATRLKLGQPLFH